ncbi:MAG: hypothetical protein J6Q58_03385 [Clostridia bacterium]|nr:hypothetical protein [Clostridia bacterium]
MPKYILCPRCDLNYILEGEEYCDVCKAHLNLGAQLMFSATDDNNDQVLCPICKVKYISIDEEMCSKCREKLEYESDNSVDVDKDDEWRQYLDDDEKDVSAIEDEEELLLSQIEEEEVMDDEDEDIDPYTNEKISKDKKSDDDFDYIAIDEKDFEDYEEEEEESEEEEDF